jgi:hypothetical protein
VRPRHRKHGTGPDPQFSAPLWFSNPGELTGWCALSEQVKKSRKDMVSAGICSILISLLKVGDYRTKVTCFQALYQLSREQELREILVRGEHCHGSRELV